MCDFFRIYNIRARHASVALVYIFVAYFFFCSKFSFIELATSKVTNIKRFTPFIPSPVRNSSVFIVLLSMHFHILMCFEVCIYVSVNSQITSNTKKELKTETRFAFFIQIEFGDILFMLIKNVSIKNEFVVWKKLNVWKICIY